MHTYLFWYHKPLCPVRSIVLPLEISLQQLAIPGLDISSYHLTPLDILISPADSRSLIAPVWFGFKCVLELFAGVVGRARRPLYTIPTSASHPPEGVGWPLTIRLILFQIMYYGLNIGVGLRLPFPTTIMFYLWERASIVDAGLIGVLLLAHVLRWMESNMRHHSQKTVNKLRNFVSGNIFNPN
jgi:hypothetical protein